MRLGAVLAKTQPVLRNTQAPIPRHALGAPVLEPGVCLRRRYEVLHLHLLELPGAEDEVPGGDLVAERLADLCDTEGWSLPGRLEHAGEVEKHPLGRLRAQVHLCSLVLDRASVGLEHRVERPWLGEVGRATVGARAGDIVCPPALLAV